MKNKKEFFALVLIFLFSKLNAGSTVDFFATKSSSTDTNMITMTTDLFYTQLLAIDGYSVEDKRNISFEEGVTISANIIFYSEIEESGDGNWICTLNAINQNSDKHANITKTYSSYYKILLDAKASIENLFASLEAGGNIRNSAKPAEKETQVSSAASETKANVEELAGTWTGEKLIDKVVILRGGKGFVIFKNGATMNISVSTDGTTIVITQTAKPNASFFPELPRELALKNAMGSEPVVWTLKLRDSKTLFGSKTTLIADDSSANGVKEGTFSVEWTKK